MSTLIVGGNGMIGAYAALDFAARGDQVTIAGRNAPDERSPLAGFDFEQIDYIANDTPAEVLSRFDTVVFSAGNDPRHNQTMDEARWVEANTIGVPRFFTSLREAGVKTAINVGSFYPQAAPHLVDVHPYIRSRKEADDGVRAMNRPGFRTISVNAPFVVGAVSGVRGGLIPSLLKYAQGKFGMEEFAIPGGVNFISTRSLVQAIRGAIDRGEGGTAYLVGDENLTFEQYFGAFFEAAGKPVPPVVDQEHPMLPDSALFHGRGNTLHYEPDPAEVELLGYQRGDVLTTIREAATELLG